MTVCNRVQFFMSGYSWSIGPIGTHILWPVRLIRDCPHFTAIIFIVFKQQVGENHNYENNVTTSCCWYCIL